MLNAQFRPLDQWPGVRTKGRKDATFRATYPQTLDLLETELAKLHARLGSVVIQVEGLTQDDVRNDGWPRGNWKGTGPGVIVSFESPKGSISMPCDKFGDWQDNLRAIAKSLEALRMVDRYGVTRGNEQYRGWAKLEAPKNGKMSRAEASEFMRSILGFDWNPLDLPGSFRKARGIYHPDGVQNQNQKDSRHEIFVRIGYAEQGSHCGG